VSVELNGIRDMGEVKLSVLNFAIKGVPQFALENFSVDMW